MKRSDIVTGLVYLGAGLAFLLLALRVDSPLGGMLFGLAGAGIGPGARMIARYFYWSRPERQAEYRERLEAEQIALHDERNAALRDRSGRYAYLLGLLVTCIAILAFSLLGALQVLPGTRLMVLYLGGYLLFQYLSGLVIYWRLAENS